ncbi:MAG: transcriptional regulator [uncultured bacterium]|nr:MAG: transcriptional regulator [uncultured bacterium]
MKTNTKLISEFLSKAVKVRRFVEQTGSFEDNATTLLQIEALKYIHANSSVTVGSLARELDMSLSSTTQLTNRLADKGWVSREIDQNDRRVTGLSLTKLGLTQIKGLINPMISSNYKVLASIPEKDLKEMIRIFGNIADSQRGENK